VSRSLVLALAVWLASLSLFGIAWFLAVVGGPHFFLLACTVAGVSTTLFGALAGHNRNGRLLRLALLAGTALVALVIVSIWVSGFFLPSQEYDSGAILEPFALPFELLLFGIPVMAVVAILLEAGFAVGRLFASS
jgi:ABC-type multidrug transport system permease subunit